MAKQRPSLEAMMDANAPLTKPQRLEAVPVSASVLAMPTARSKARVHTSLYVSKEVLRTLRRVAAELDKRPHDLLLEGVNDLLTKHGRPSIAEIDGNG